MIKVFLNQVDISLKTEVDLSFVEKLDMELDEAFLVIAHTNRPNQYDMFSIIDIYEDDTLLFSGRVSQDNVELSSFSDEIYNHKISLIEHTKVLEKFLITGKSFTQPIDETTVPFYTLYDVIEILRKTAKLEIVGNIKPFTTFSIPNETKEFLENIVAPEFNFKDVTLRQALNEVLFYVNGIARLNNNGQLIIEFFNDLKDEINFVTENYKRSQDIQNYSVNMSSDMLNSVNTELGFTKYNTEFFPGKSLWTTLRSNIGQFNFEQAYIPTSKPIYGLKNLYVMTDVTINIYENIADVTGETHYLNDKYENDISSQVVERSEYETLEREDPANYGDKTRRNVLVYDYAEKNIKVGETYGLFDLDIVINDAIYHATANSLVKDGILPPGGEVITDGDNQFGYYMDVEYYVVTFNALGNLSETTLFKRWKSLWRVNYTPIVPSIRYEVERDDVSEVRFDSKSIANQKLRIVDLERFTNNMKSRVNQLGSGKLILSHKVSSINDSYNVGDFTPEAFVITKKEVIVQRDHYIINYELNKNFNKMSQFMGIDQEIRQYEIGEKGRSVDRDLNYNEYVMVYSTDELPQNDTNDIETLVKPEILTNSFGELTEDETLKYCVVTSQDTSDEIILPVYKLSGGNAFGFYTDFTDNISAGNELTNDDDENDFDLRNYNLPYKYTNEIGRLSNMKFDVYSEDKIPEDTFNEEVLLSKNYPNFVGDLPTSKTISGDFEVQKDNRERIKFTLLYHLLPKNIGDVVVGEKLLSNNYYLSDEENKIFLRFWNDKQNFTIRNKNIQLTDQDLLISNPSITIEESLLTINESSLSSYSSYAITDEDGYPFIMVNSNNKYIKFDFKNKRPGVNYNFFPVKTEEVQLVAPSVAKTEFDGGGGVFEFEQFTSSATSQTILEFTLQTFEGVSLNSNAIANSIIDFTEEQAPGVSLSSISISQTTIDFNAIPIEGEDLLSQAISKPIIDITSNPVPGFKGVSQSVSSATIEVVREEPVQLSSQTTSSATLEFTASGFEKVWVSKTLSGPFDVTLDLGEVSSCPGILQARDELEAAFPSENQEIGDKANVTSYRITNGFLDPCPNYTYEVEVE